MIKGGLTFKMSEAVYGSMIELQCLNYLFQTNSFQLVILNGLTEDHFSTYKEHFKFIRDFYNKYQQLPSKETFQGKFADNFEWLTVTDPEEYLIEKLNESKLYRDLIKDYKHFAKLITSEKTDEALEQMGAIAQKYMKEKQAPCIDLISNAQVRYENYMNKVKHPETAVVSTGLPELDDVFGGGWDRQNEMATIVARTGYGKSWWLIYFALQAAKAGLRVGYYSGEMDPDLVGYRLDTFLGNIANGSLTHGNDNVKNEYTDYIDTLNSTITGHVYCLTPQMLGGFATVSKLRAFVEKYDIQFLCVDQYSLLEDERKAYAPNEQMANLSKDLVALQKLKRIPILSASQQNRTEVDKDGPTTRNISGSDRIGHDATTVLFIERKSADQVTFVVGKARNGRTGDKLTYFWQINTGQLIYMPTDKDAKKGEESEQVEQSYNDTEKSNSVF